jgi:hypothetical protein
VGERPHDRARGFEVKEGVLPGLGGDGVFSFDSPDLLQQPILEHLDFC